MRQPKFKLGDLVIEKNTSNSFFIKGITIHENGIFYFKNRTSMGVTEEELELCQEPKKKKLYAYQWETSVRFLSVEIGGIQSNEKFFKRAPEFDIPFPGDDPMIQADL